MMEGNWFVEHVIHMRKKSHGNYVISMDDFPMIFDSHKLNTRTKYILNIKLHA